MRAISIHAPTRGATLSTIHKHISKMISIHAPTRGATTAGIWADSELEISIHAPTRGATLNGLVWGINIPTFQSTLPREERRWQQAKRFWNCDFNPRSHERSDINITDYRMIINISIHAPTRGATDLKLKLWAGVQFQSTLPREERPKMG